MKVAAGDDDVRVISCNSFDPIAPAARCFDGGFDRFRAAAGRQCFGGLCKISDFYQFGEKRSELGRVICARSNGNALRWSVSAATNAMRMAMTDSGMADMKSR